MERLPPPPLPPWLEALLPFERWRVRLGGYALHVMEHGAGRPVLFIHGNPSWGFLWRKVVAGLRDAPVRCVMPDLLGLGLSDKPRDGRVHTLELHARLVGELVDALDLRDVVLVVQDWGGPIGMAAMAERRERLGGLVVLNTSLSAPRPGFRSTAFHRFARVPVLGWAAFRLGGFPQRALGRVQGDRRSIRGEVARAYSWPLRGLRNNAAPLALARMVPDSMAHPSVPGLRQVEELARSFDGPAEIVWGERDPILGRSLRRVAGLLPRARVTRTRGGHFLQEEEPSEIACAVARVAGV